jgi:nitrate/nitrite transport system substrate-binding protein
MALLMTLNQNGQGLTLSRALAERGAVDAASLAQVMPREPRRYTFAQTFPTGTHAMWPYHWLASAGINPTRDVNVVTVPPPQRVASMRQGHVDGFSVGEPWNQRAAVEGVGVLAATSPQVWPGHPEKVLGCTAAFADAYPNTARAVIAAVLDASRWIDESDAHREQTAATLSRADYIDTAVDSILPRRLGHDDTGLGRQWTDADAMRFFGNGSVNFPYLSDGLWFLTQYRRWGLLERHPDDLATATRINRIELYEAAANRLGIALPPSPLRSSRLIDGVVWNGSEPARCADGFAIGASQPQAA